MASPWLSRSLLRKAEVQWLIEPPCPTAVRVRCRGRCSRQRKPWCSARAALLAHPPRSQTPCCLTLRRPGSQRWTPRARSRAAQARNCPARASGESSGKPIGPSSSQAQPRSYPVLSLVGVRNSAAAVTRAAASVCVVAASECKSIDAGNVHVRCADRPPAHMYGQCFNSMPRYIYASTALDLWPSVCAGVLEPSWRACRLAWWGGLAQRAQRAILASCCLLQGFV